MAARPQARHARRAGVVDRPPDRRIVLSPRKERHPARSRSLRIGGRNRQEASGGGGSTQVDVDPQETREWLEAIEAVVEHDGAERAQVLLERVVGHAQLSGAAPAPAGMTPYLNPIPPQSEPEYPVDEQLERRLRSIMRWNATAMVLNANKESSELGGHIASYQSAAVLYELGFDHFWHAPSEQHGGDLVYIQGHSSPGIYARAFLEGRLTEEQMRTFRQEVGGNGLSSYPHAWLMPDFWQFPTVSMGLGPIMAIYQARFMKYLKGRDLADTDGRKVWVFLGDGETDEPESLGAISLGGRDHRAPRAQSCQAQRRAAESVAR